MSPLEGLLSRVDESEQRYAKRNKARRSATKSIEKGDFIGANSQDNLRDRMQHLKVDADIAERVGTRSLESLAPTAPRESQTRDSRAVIEAVALERILGSNDMMPISFLELGRQRARSVGRIHIRDRNGMGQGFGTGFMVSPNLMLTNNHVLSDEHWASASEVEFDFEVDLTGELRSSQKFRLDPDGFFLTNKPLDFSLVKVVPADGLEPQQWGWIPLVQQEGLIVKGEYVSIIQHPNGEAKQLALRENRVIDLLNHFAHYQTDTAPGSSGSPVFNDQWELVALHHSGVPDRSPDGKILSVDGQPWKKWMGEHRIKWVANEGVSGKRIADFIQQEAQLATAHKPLRDELFTVGAPPPPQHVSAPPSGAAAGTPTTLHSVEASGTSRTTAVAGTAVAGTTVAGTTVAGTTITIPLQIQIGIGDLGSNTATSVSAILPASDVSAPAQPTTTPSQTTPPPSTTTIADSILDADDSSLRNDLASVEDARGRTYYDATKDEVDRAEYYGALTDGERSNQEMFRLLSELLKATHHTKVRYRPSRHVYPWIDLHPDRQLRSIYSGKTFEPEALIREDFRIEQERMIMLRQLVQQESSLTEDEMQEQTELLERQNPFNCEHVVPQSWFGKLEPMRGDLHHLFACESGCNSFRGNLGYFDFSDFDEATRTACGKRVDTRFEPGFGKGVVARATLYFLLRYPSRIEDPGELPKDRISMLLHWHGDFPVTDYERHRNQAIAEKQGNRNPLIDFPDWAAKIDFTVGLG